MRIVFLGSSQFACNSLEELIKEHFDIKAVITQPDKPKGRTLKLFPTPIKVFAKKHNLETLEPNNLKSEQFIEKLKNFNADLFIVVAYGKILTEEILSLPKIFTINLHGSLLPKYRGAAPINWALINGDTKTGVTIAKVNKILDSGEIITQKEIPVNSTDNATSLSQKLAKTGAIELIKSVGLIQKNNFKLIPQDENKVTYARKITKQDGLINWKNDAQTIINLWRGTFGWPGIYTYLNNKIIKILDIKINTNFCGNPGQILDISPESVIVGCQDASILIKKLQPESRKIISAQEFIQGYKIKVGEFFD